MGADDMTNWYQFSVWDDSAKDDFPPDAFEFIRTFYYAECGRLRRWHYLFEPHVLVRFQCAGRPEAESIFATALQVAGNFGLHVAQGDLEGCPSPSGFSGFEFFGEHKFYGGAELWEAAADFSEAASRLGILLSDKQRFKRYAGKFVHLLANHFGLDYEAEAAWLEARAKRSRQLSEERGAQ